MQYLRRHRCLLVLDNGESILQEGKRSQAYRAGYEGYGELLRQIGQGVHQSCLVLTSREKPREVMPYAGELPLTRSLQVRGLSLLDAQTLLSAFGLKEAFAEQELVRRYQGNPLLLKIAVASILDLFDQDIVDFLNQHTVVFNGIRHLLDQQFARLDSLERQVMYWLYRTHLRS